MPLSKEQIAFENDWAQRWLTSTGTLRPELWVDPFYQADAVVMRGELPALQGIDAIREGVTEMCQMFSLFEASKASVILDETESRLIIFCDMTISLSPDPEHRKFTSPAAIVIKKALGVNEEKMLEEQAILDRSALSQRLMELGLLPLPAAKA